jgi:hypothetical protein
MIFTARLFELIEDKVGDRSPPEYFTGFILQIIFNG